ncbi:unnamed protein product [Pseudo-nitzschia multistriata]|uniref:Uncharacterized protein n=1 Tax=Pseudo-nitzschia multistriata TaxID=183589 RepID=A0A448ZT12_9STRA|nr:unnamed protein product [Pseudo-nitzschia multistriata]
MMPNDENEMQTEVWCFREDDIFVNVDDGNGDEDEDADEEEEGNENDATCHDIIVPRNFLCMDALGLTNEIDDEVLSFLYDFDTTTGLLQDEEEVKEEEGIEQKEEKEQEREEEEEPTKALNHDKQIISFDASSSSLVMKPERDASYTPIPETHTQRTQRRGGLRSRLRLLRLGRIGRKNSKKESTTSAVVDCSCSAISSISGASASPNELNPTEEEEEPETTALEEKQQSINNSKKIECNATHDDTDDDNSKHSPIPLVLSGSSFGGIFFDRKENIEYDFDDDATEIQSNVSSKNRCRSHTTKSEQFSHFTYNEKSDTSYTDSGSYSDDTRDSASFSASNKSHSNRNLILSSANNAKNDNNGELLRTTTKVNSFFRNGVWSKKSKSISFSLKSNISGRKSTSSEFKTEGNDDESSKASTAQELWQARNEVRRIKQQKQKHTKYKRTITPTLVHAGNNSQQFNCDDDPITEASPLEPVVNTRKEENPVDVAALLLNQHKVKIARWKSEQLMKRAVAKLTDSADEMIETVLLVGFDHEDSYAIQLKSVPL